MADSGVRCIRAVHRESRRDGATIAFPVRSMTASTKDRLDSWKEIATFLNRGVRTVQRWEATEGLPVRRHQHRKLGSVFALKSEVAAWWESRSADLSPETRAVQPAEAGTARKMRLMVLPFENLSEDRTQEYLADGFTEEMITQLARLQPERLAVIARATAMHYKSTRKRADRIARELKVDYLLEGSLRREGSNVRVTAQLIQASDQTHRWAQNYDRDLASALVLQNEVAGAIANEIQLALTPETQATLGVPRAIHPVAYEDYLRGRYHLNHPHPEALAQSVAWFQRAIEKDPTFPLAHASLSHALALLAMVPFDVLPPREAMPKARTAATRALELDPTLPEAHAALAVVRHHFDWDWKGAEEEYHKALTLNAEYPGARLRYAWLLLSLSRAEEAHHQIELAQRTAQETDPHLLVVIRATRAAAFYFAREYDRSIRECLEAMELDPNYFLLHYLLARAHARKGAHKKAGAVLKKIGASQGKISLMAMAGGLLCAVSGRKTQARAAVKQLHRDAAKRYVPATYIGILHAGLGETESAFEWLERAYEERADGLTLLNVEPMVDGLRSDTRFQRLIERIGFEGEP
jgi:TolB-like protein/Tfp pilus assembly protein PilF